MVGMLTGSPPMPRTRLQSSWRVASGVAGDLASESLQPIIIEDRPLSASMRQGLNMPEFPALMKELLDPAHSQLKKFSDPPL